MAVNGISGPEPIVLVQPAAAHDPPARTRTAEARENTAPVVRDGSGPGKEEVQHTAGGSRAALAENQQSSVRMRVDKASKQVVTRIVDANNEVIRQIPPEELLKIARKMRELEGVLFDRKA